tara:strand:- start:355 stop:1287 length:933 start_codon:yes stop_codon:yes gene_type:complete
MDNSSLFSGSTTKLKKYSPNKLTQNLHKNLPIQSTEVGESIVPMLDSLYELSILQLALYSRVYAIRVNLLPCNSIFQMDTYIDKLTKKLSRLFYVGKERINKKIRHLWCRELNSKEFTNAFHYHILLLIPAPNNRTVKSVYDEVGKKAIEQIQQNVRYESLNSNNERLYKDNGWKWDEMPSVTKSGYFILDRPKLTKEEQEKQRIEMQEKVDSSSNLGYHSLLIEKIQTRKHNKNLVLGGVFTEYYYASSYLCKLASKRTDNKSIGRSDNSFHGSRRTAPNYIKEDSRKLAKFEENKEQIIKSISSYRFP